MFMESEYKRGISMAKMNSFENLRQHSWKMVRSTHPASYQKTTFLTCPCSVSEPGQSHFMSLRSHSIVTLHSYPALYSPWAVPTTKLFPWGRVLPSALLVPECGGVQPPRLRYFVLLSQPVVPLA